MPTVDPHAQFCCLTHGCRFNNNERCSVVTGQVVQLYKCGESAICSEYQPVDQSEGHDAAPYEN